MYIRWWYCHKIMRALLIVLWFCRGACGYQCDTCPAGQMVSLACTDANNTVCASCPAYTFSLSPSSTECVSVNTCTAGSYFVSASAGCQTCPQGSYCPNVKSVITCAAGYSCPAGSTAPVACPASGYACPLGTAYAIACSVCGAGQYLRAPCTLSSNTVCGGCPIGLYCTGLCFLLSFSYQFLNNQPYPTGGTALPASCTAQCLSGQYESTACTATTNRVCTDCTPGPFYCSDGISRGVCTTCGAGKYEISTCTGTADRVCGTCNAEYYCLGSPNLQIPCTTCAVGQYQKTACLATANRVCSTCSPGFMCPSAGLTAGQACTSGTYAPGAGMSMCLTCSLPNCGPGTYLVPCNSTADMQCRACPTGSYYCNGSTTIIPCTATCVNGTYESQACTPQANRECLPCPPGAYCNRNNIVTPINCTRCMPGYFESSPCTNSTDRRCTPCRAGAYFCNGSTTIANCTKACPAGAYRARECTNATDLVCINHTAACEPGKR